MFRHNIIITILSVTIMNQPAIADLPRNNSPEELERWFNSNDDDKSWKPEDINDGQLSFLTRKPRLAPHVADNRITITTDSLSHGWVLLTQCHTQLDIMPAAQIVYQNQPVKRLRIIEQSNIGKSWVEANSVQLKHIRENAKICVQAEIKALTKLAGQQYSLNTGPYRRKFLDGYFPVALSLSIKYPPELKAVQFLPQAQPGMEIVSKNQSITINALFEGELTSTIRFSSKTSR